MTRKRKKHICTGLKKNEKQIKIFIKLTEFFKNTELSE